MISDLNQLMSSVEKNISYQVKTITSDGCIYTFYNSYCPHLTVVCLNQIVVCGNMARYILFNLMCILAGITHLVNALPSEPSLTTRSKHWKQCCLQSRK